MHGFSIVGWFDFETTISACFACIGNIGPGFAMVGPFGNFSAFSDLSKIVLSFAMLIGRLGDFPYFDFSWHHLLEKERNIVLPKPIKCS